MTSKKTRLESLLHTLNIDYETVEVDSYLKDEEINREYLRKAELKAAMEALGLDTDGTMEQLRDRIRTEIRRLSSKKLGTTEFSSYEIRKINNEIRDELRLHPEDIVDFEELEVGQRIEVNGERYPITRISSKETESADKFDGYNMLALTTGTRLMHLVNSNKYASSQLALEKKKSEHPYPKWSKISYVYDFEMVS